jgi:hypothetical protein
MHICKHKDATHTHTDTPQADLPQQYLCMSFSIAHDTAAEPAERKRQHHTPKHTRRCQRIKKGGTTKNPRAQVPLKHKPPIMQARTHRPHSQPRRKKCQNIHRPQKGMQKHTEMPPCVFTCTLTIQEKLLCNERTSTLEQRLSACLVCQHSYQSALVLQAANTS